ncbi:MAG: class B sortase [Coriobacteriia bacterium]|nr:class B sortase [Coriobacteriia bacterium]
MYPPPNTPLYHPGQPQQPTYRAPQQPGFEQPYYQQQPHYQPLLPPQPPEEKKPKRRRGFMGWFMVFVGAALVVFALYQITSIWWEYYRADKGYTDLAEAVTDEQPIAEDGIGQTEAMLQAARERRIDFAELQLINDEIIAWIFIPGTRIDYPVAQTDDNDFYLRHNFQREYSAGGCPFLEAGLSPDFKELDARVYAHHMQDRSMFGELPYWRDPEFADLHQHIFIYTPNQTREYMVIDQSVIAGAAPPVPVNLASSAQFLTLITCEYDFQDARYFLRSQLSAIFRPGGERY